MAGEPWKLPKSSEFWRTAEIGGAEVGGFVVFGANGDKSANNRFEVSGFLTSFAVEGSKGGGDIREGDTAGPALGCNVGPGTEGVTDGTAYI